MHQLEKCVPGIGTGAAGQHNIACSIVLGNINFVAIETKLNRQTDSLTGPILEKLGRACFFHDSPLVPDSISNWEWMANFGVSVSCFVYLYPIPNHNLTIRMT